MATVRLTRVVAFAAAHRYFRPDWSPERNAATFGKCGSEHGHGHSYQCRVTVVGELDPETSMLMSLDDLDAMLREEVTERLDHRHLNYDVPEFAFGKRLPTVEALAVFLWERLAPRMPPGVGLECVCVQEDPTLYAEYRGGQ